MSDILPPRTLVIVAGNLGEIVHAARFGGASGYDVSFTPQTSLEGTAPHFCQDWTVKRAELGVNVCKASLGRCFCGLTHIRHPERLETSTS